MKQSIDSRIDVLTPQSTVSISYKSQLSLKRFVSFVSCKSKITSREKLEEARIYGTILATILLDNHYSSLPLISKPNAHHRKDASFLFRRAANPNTEGPSRFKKKQGASSVFSFPRNLSSLESTTREGKSSLFDIGRVPRVWRKQELFKDNVCLPKTDFFIFIFLTRSEWNFFRMKHCNSCENLSLSSNCKKNVMEK